MKKIFFSAALAIVAVGSALSVNAITVYTKDLGWGGLALHCGAGTFSCESLIGNVYYEQSGQITPQTPVTIEDLEDTARN